MGKQKIEDNDLINTDNGLTDKQKHFCMLYVGECQFNASKAAEMAGYSENTSRTIGSKLLTNIDIQTYINELKADLGKRIGITSEMIAREYALIGFSKMSDFIDDENDVKNIKQIGEEKSKIISSLKKTVNTFDGGEKITIEIKLHDKISALDKLAKMIGVQGVDKSELINPPNVTPQIVVYNSAPPLKENESDI